MKIKPTLTILDAVRILRRTAPRAADCDVKNSIPSSWSWDEVAIDSYGATLFGLKGRDLGYVTLGHKRGWGRWI